MSGTVFWLRRTNYIESKDVAQEVGTEQKNCHIASFSRTELRLGLLQAEPIQVGLSNARAAFEENKSTDFANFNWEVSWTAREPQLREIQTLERKHAQRNESFY